MYLDFHEEDNFKPQPIPDIDYLTYYLDEIRSIGVNHLALNIRFNTMDIDDTLEPISKHVSPEFYLNKKNTQHHE
jgi:hypothetical protein